VLDITDLRAAKEGQRKSEARFAKVFMRNPAAIGLVTPEGLLLDVNETYATMFGYSREAMLGHTVHELDLWADPSQRSTMIQQLVGRGSLRNVDARFQRKNGEIFDAVASMEELELEDETVLMTMFTDVTELKRSREELRLLARGLQAIREDERTRMAREIHDELGQALTAIKMDLSWMRQRLRRDQRPLTAHCSAVMKLADSTIDTVRRLSAELRPAVLDDLGLPAAVEWVVEDYQRRSGLDVALDLQADHAVVSRDLATAVFRILQEALTNVARHAAARHVDVKLVQEDHSLILEVRDDGRGMPVETLNTADSLGVLGMRERAAGEGGELALSSVPGGGTVVQARFPLESVP
jgi:PAS domain S-box-containing protein